MRNTKHCPKCGSPEIGIVCVPFCGFTEEWIERGALEKVRKYYGSSSEQSEWNI